MAFDAKALRSSRLKVAAAYIGLGLASAGCAGGAPVSTVGWAVAVNGLTIQLLRTPDVSGNARVTVTNNPPAGTTPPPYLVVGVQGNPIILRDDGVGADLVARDNVYSTFAFANADDLARRHADEVNLIDTYKISSVLQFSGRAVSGRAVPLAFDSDGFNRGQVASFNPSNIFSLGNAPVTASSLLVNDPNVVADGDPTRTWNPCTGAGTKMGAFTFGHLMTELANQPLTGIDPANMVMQWLQTWQTNQTVNTFTVAARPAITPDIIAPWLAASGGVKLDLGIAPFRLLAIVNRIDLRTGSSGLGGTTGNAGEVRFVFGAVIPGPTCQLLPFTVIFEYGVPITGCLDVRTWAKQWVSLGNLTLGTAPYNAALQALTDKVVLRNAAPGKPNGSALDQLRTNENALNVVWELRQFNLLAFPSDSLHQTPVFRTPDIKYNAADPLFWNHTTSVDTWIVGNKAQIDDGSYVLPLTVSGAGFLGGSALNPNGTAHFWNTSTLDLNPAHPVNWNKERHIFGLNACNGCHERETNTSFTHIFPNTPLGSPAQLSGFMTGVTVTDAAFGSPSRTFNDLARRQSDLQGVAQASCLHFPAVVPDFVAAALHGLPIPPELAAQPVPPVAQQGTFFIEDFFKDSIQGH
jgi:hypothetical protein